MHGGRKLEFDKSKALDAAMRMFWTKGYQGTSISDLTETMGINKPSMYATFGNKEALFVQATNYYLKNYAKPKAQCLYDTKKPLKTRLKNYMLAVINGQCDEQLPKGCYLSLCIGEAGGGSIPDAARLAVEEAGSFPLKNLEGFLKTDPEAKKRNMDADAKERALFLVAMLNGTAVLARAGFREKDLKPLVDRALAAVEL